MKKTLTSLESPFTGGRVFEVETTQEREFRKEKFMAHCRYYVCEDTGQEFTGDEQDDLWTNEVYGQWRAKHGVPFPDEIRATRLRYGMNYVQISKILGFGANQWKQYEDGIVPSESNGKMMRAVERKQTMLEMLTDSRPLFDEAEYSRLVARVNAVTDSSATDVKTILFYGADCVMSVMNGFGAHNPQRVSAMVRYLIDGNEICPTKLNKLMFYADFHHYRKTGRSISGLQYRAIQYGPVPERYRTIYENVDGVEGLVRIVRNMECTALYCKKEAVNDESSPLTASEIQTLDSVLELYGHFTTSEIVELSHKETAWNNHMAGHDLIPYSEAFELNSISR